MAVAQSAVGIAMLILCSSLFGAFCANPESILLQKTGIVSTSVDSRLAPVLGEPAVAEEDRNVTELQAEIRSLKHLILDMRKSVEAKMGACCGCTGGNSERTPNTSPGLCAVFGDPHFTTFDGAHTILLKDMTLWLVRSQDVWIQGLSLTTTGNFMGLAVSGPFMKNHTLIFYNHTEQDTTSNPGQFTVLFDGQPILTEWDSKGCAEFEEPFIMWAARRKEWNISMHDNTILEIDPAIDFAVGPWPDRFQNTPKGGLYLFRLPNDVEITITGVDFMSAVIKMKPQEGGQSGYCGNFDNSATDEFEPPAEGSVPDALIPAWNTAAGVDLEPVSDGQNLFKRGKPNAALSLLVKKAAAGAERPNARLPERCRNSAVLQEAALRCKEIPNQNMRLNCIIDICITGNAAVVDDIGSAEVLEDQVNAQGVAQFVGFGTCLGPNGLPLRALKTAAVRTGPSCQGLLRKLGSHTDVIGAQLKVEGVCEVLVKSTANIETIKETAKLAGGWQEEPVAKQGDEFLDGVKPDLSWSCWKLH